MERKDVSGGLPRLTEDLVLLARQAERDAQAYGDLDAGDLPNGMDMSVQQEITDVFADTAQAMLDIGAQATEGAEMAREIAQQYETLARQAQQEAEAALGLGVQTVERVRQNAQTMFDRIGAPDDLAGMIGQLALA